MASGLFDSDCQQSKYTLIYVWKFNIHDLEYIYKSILRVSIMYDQEHLYALTQGNISNAIACTYRRVYRLLYLSENVVLIKRLELNRCT